MPKKHQALEELQRRWRDIFSSLAGGQDVPPSQRLRAEGMMETLVLLELATEAELGEALADCYLECFGTPLEDDWQEWFPFPQVPGFGRRAPVYPSTPD